MNMDRLILGSTSPRRKELLSNLGVSFDVVAPNAAEVRRAGEGPRDYVVRNVKEKTEAVLLQLKSQQVTGAHNKIIICADTIVCIDNHLLEKPSNKVDATRMLGLLSGRQHVVMTAYGIVSKEEADNGNVNWNQIIKVCETNVQIKDLSKDDIEGYIATGEPYDKAGGYAAQGIGSFMVQSIVGSYSNVVGLPICEVAGELVSRFGVKLFSK